MTLLKDNNYKEINVALLSLEADIKNKISGFDTSVIDKQLAEINSRIDKINAGSNNTSDEIEDINSKLNRNSNKIRNIEQNIEDIDTQIDGIEQKLSDIFSAENKVTDFNTTKDSGIYYWIDDAANKPSDYGVLLVNKFDSGSGSTWINQIAYSTNNKIYFRQNINSGNWTEWKAVAFEGEVKASFLDEYVGAGGTRPTSGNIVPKDSSEYGGMRKDVVTSSMTAGGYPGQDGHLLTMFWDNSGRYDSQFFVSNERALTVKVRTKANGEDYGPWVDLITSNNIGSQTVAKAGNADTAGTANYAKNMYYQNLDLSALDKTKFYPLVGSNWVNFAEVAICSESLMGSAEYNQNRIHFDISTMGWSDLKPTLNIREYGCYENNEITIGCIGRGMHRGAWAIWLRGGIHYTCFSRGVDLSLKTSDYTYDDETYTVGTNYYGGSNSNVSIFFTPQHTITEGAYSTRPITAPKIKADYRMVIPIGEPASLEDGCIWIER